MWPKIILNIITLGIPAIIEAIAKVVRAKNDNQKCPKKTKKKAVPKTK